MKPCAILQISQSVHRVPCRDDVKVSTLTSHCGSLFAPSVGRYLTPAQCFALQGWAPSVFEDVSRRIVHPISPDEYYRMAGNGMSLPVVGTHIMIAVSQLRPR